MIRLPRLRDLDPDLSAPLLPFYLRFKWLWAEAGVAMVAQFLWAWGVVWNQSAGFRGYLRLGISVFVFASSFGYFFARLGSRFMGVSWIKILRGKERMLDTWLGRVTAGSGISLTCLPIVVNEFFGAELLIPVPFYSGAVVGMAFGFYLWSLGLPR